MCVRVSEGIAHSAVLLAGGKSQRMGQDKAALMVDSRPLWKRQHETLAATQPHELFISIAEGQRLPEGEHLLKDRHSNIGPLGGLATALEMTNSPLLLVLAVDLPDMDADFLNRMLSFATPEKGVVPIMDGFYEPLAAIYPVTLLPLVQAAVEQKSFRLQDLMKAAVDQGLLSTYEIEPQERPLFRNLNRPQDL